MHIDLGNIYCTYIHTYIRTLFQFPLQAFKFHYIIILKFAKIGTYNKVKEYYLICFSIKIIDHAPFQCFLKWASDFCG